LREASPAAAETVSDQHGNGVAVPGCPNCRKRLHTIAQFVEHLANDVLPDIVDDAIGLKEPGME
jgi:hypothetical protein